MQDIQLFINKLRSDADHCSTISQTATSDAKRKVFIKLAETYRNLAEELKRILDTSAILDEQRDSHLLSLLRSDECDQLNGGR